jgi:hypothetical protein
VWPVVYGVVGGGWVGRGSCEKRMIRVSRSLDEKLRWGMEERGREIGRVCSSIFSYLLSCV